jgi:uncharacterized protein (DUF58 family)
MAASLASHALEAGLSVGLLARMPEDWSTLAPARGKRHRRDLLAILARLPLNTAWNTKALLEQSRLAVEPGITPVLITPNDVSLGLSDALRSGLVIVSAKQDQSRRWFRFPETVRFDRCMPAEDEPRMENNEKRKAKNEKREDAMV